MEDLISLVPRFGQALKTEIAEVYARLMSNPELIWVLGFIALLAVVSLGANIDWRKDACNTK